MSKKYKFHNHEATYFISFAVQGWADVFTRNEYKNIVVESLKYCQQNKGLEIFAWCIMTNHLHLIVRAKETYVLPDIMRDFKKYTAKSILTAILENNQESRNEWLIEQFKTEKGNRFWQEENHPIELWSGTVIMQKLHYLHQNPVEAGIVFKAEDYVYSSARDYAGEKGLLDIILI